MNTPNLSAQELGDSLHRTLKLALDEGDAPSIEEAQRLFDSYRLCVRVGANVAVSPTRQAMLLSVVNTAARCFLGGVVIEGCPDADLLVPWRSCRTLREAVIDLGGRFIAADEVTTPLLLIGDCPGQDSDGVLRLSFDGWCGAVTPLDEEPLTETSEMTLSGVLAGALGVSEAFQFVRGKNIQAGRRAVGLSLWKPGLDPWRNPDAQGPQVEFLPSQLWIIGLGHLGQAYLWSLGFLPFARPKEVEIVLQDTDVLQQSNLSTSVLTRARDLGRMKTRAMAKWCEERGFQTRIVERLFADDFRVGPQEPKIALCGVDNPQARACLQDVGFSEVLEAGLGSRGEQYLALKTHAFSTDSPETGAARCLWGEMVAQNSFEQALQSPAYRDLEQRGIDACGLTTLADRAVGASFVGVFASTLIVADLLRVVTAAHRYRSIEVSLRNPQMFTPRQSTFEAKNALPWTRATTPYRASDGVTTSRPDRC